MNANDPKVWDTIWAREGKESWRQSALAGVYARISTLVARYKPERVIDAGGGIGLLATDLNKVFKGRVIVWDHSPMAVDLCLASGLEAYVVDLEGTLPRMMVNDWVISTETFEHLSAGGREDFIVASTHAKAAIISVPNNRLGPDEEPQHTVKYTAIEFLNQLRRYWENARVEVIDGYLVGICGEPAVKKTTMSVCFPARDEEDDIEATLASFRGVADEIVVGVDPRSSDRTESIAREYADIVFELTDPSGPEGDRVEGENKVHFAWIRNQCMDRCTKQWIFMTEAHERLLTGSEALIYLDLPDHIQVCTVLRTSQEQQWGFPWLTKNSKSIRYVRAVHNYPEWPEGTYVANFPHIKTRHERSNKNADARASQRRVQNRLHLMEDWALNHNEASLFYLGSEWREWDAQRAVRYLEELISLPKKNGPMRYQARLILAKTLGQLGEYSRARDVLLGCTSEDWSRTEHWLWLGDLAREQERWEEALQFYQYAASRISDPPFSVFWIDIHSYTYLPAQRLAMTYTDLNNYPRALHWARCSLDLLPEDVPPEVVDEHQNNITVLEEAVSLLSTNSETQE